MRAAAVVVAILVSGCGERPAPAMPRVVRIIDGDTVAVLWPDKRQETIRLAGIDAPERGQAFGNRAREALGELAMGKPVAVDVEGHDRYGRTIARLRVGGVDVCRELVARGLAWHYKRYSSDPELAEAEQAARAAGRGLWAERAPEPPWDYRGGEAGRRRQPESAGK